MAEATGPVVFETEGDVLEEGLVKVPEKAGKPAAAVEGSEDVVAVKINAQRALDRFRGKELEADSVDFSGRLSGRNGCHGYIVRPEYSLAAAGEPETPEQRFNRLQSEVTELLAELDAAKAAAPAAASGVTPAVLAAEVGQLQQLLQSAKLEALLGPDAAALKASAGLQGDLTTQLLGEIAKAATAATGSADAPAQATATAATTAVAGPGGDAVTYELFYKPEHAKFAQLSSLAALEQRLARLEGSLGVDSLAAVAVELDAPGVSLNTAVVNLTRRVVALSADDLTDVKLRVDQLLLQVETLKTKAADAAAGVAASEHVARVKELHELTKRWDATATALPSVIERLQTLKRLHERGAEFGQTLTELETVQVQLKDSLATQGAVLSTVEASLAANMAAVDANVKALDARMDALTKNLAKLK